MSWGREHARVLNVRAMMLGAIGRPGAPRSPVDLDPDHYLWLIEGLVRDVNEKNNELLDRLYTIGDARQQRLKAQNAPRNPAQRAAAIDNFARFALG